MKYVTPSWGNPTPYSKIMMSLAKKEARMSEG